MKPETPDYSEFEVAAERQLSVLPPLPVPIKPSLTSRAIDRVVPDKGKLLLFSWIMAVAVLALIFSGLQGSATRFYGIAESQTQAISFQYPVEIVQVPVVAGQRVDHRTRLLQVRRYDLDVKLAVIEDKINEITAQRATLKRSIAADIERLDGERLAATEALTTRIKNLDTRYRLNRKLVASVSAEAVDAPAAKDNPLLVHIEGLEAERRQIENLYQSRMVRLRRELQQKQDPDAARIAELQKQRGELERQSRALSIVAPFDGSIGSVAYKPGEQVEAFNEIMSVIGSSTRQIRAYVHEAVLNEARPGQSVWIQPLDAGGTDLAVNGRIKSMGSQIVEYPDRLKRNPMVSAWGREVIIEVEQTSDLLVGEKVAVLLERPLPMRDRIIALADRFIPVSSVLARVSASPILISASEAGLESGLGGIEAGAIEASGLVDSVYDDSFYLVSDEHAAIFVLRPEIGLVDSLELPAVPGIDDVESISRDGDRFYLLASLTPKRDGETLARRRQFARFRLQANKVVEFESIDLYQVLDDLRLDAGTDAELSQFLENAMAQEAVEIEAHRVVDDRLYLGFKKPFAADGRVLMLRINRVANLFDEAKIEAELWLKLDLRHPQTGKPTRLTDFDITPSGLYLLSVARKDGKPASLVWHYDFERRRLRLLTRYEGLNAEGISVNRDETEATIVFDGGGKSPSRIAREGI